MKSIEALTSKKMLTAVGLMSGTSMDGVDAALVDLSADEDRPSVRVREFVSQPYPDALRDVLIDLASGQAVTAAELAALHTSVAVAFAGSFFEVCRRGRMDPGNVDFIGSHGQTVGHVPPAPETSVAGTLQLGPPGMIASLCGVTTVGDFRGADIAAGGQGAPLVPYADYRLRRSDHSSRIILNIGGIANVTWLPAGCRADQVIAFDTGPGNMVMDMLHRALFTGGEGFDRDGADAVRGSVSEELLEELLRHPFFATPPPRSTGSGEFGAPFAWHLQALAQSRGLSRYDTMATAAALTARSIADVITRYILSSGAVDEIFLSGGGAYNRAVTGALASLLPDIALRAIDELGVSADAREAVDFALLARETLFGRINVIPSVTGARRAQVLGTIARGGVA